MNNYNEEEEPIFRPYFLKKMEEEYNHRTRKIIITSLIYVFAVIGFIRTIVDIVHEIHPDVLIAPSVVLADAHLVGPYREFREDLPD